MGTALNRIFFQQFIATILAVISSSFQRIAMNSETETFRRGLQNVPTVYEICANTIVRNLTLDRIPYLPLPTIVHRDLEYSFVKKEVNSLIDSIEVDVNKLDSFGKTFRNVVNEFETTDINYNQDEIISNDMNSTRRFFCDILRSIFLSGMTETWQHVTLFIERSEKFRDNDSENWDIDQLKNSQQALQEICANIRKSQITSTELINSLKVEMQHFQSQMFKSELFVLDLQKYF